MNASCRLKALADYFVWDLSQATDVSTRIHTEPAAFGKIMSELKPRRAVGYHCAQSPENSVTKEQCGDHGWRAWTYDGPLALARDLMVINVTRDDAVVRMATVDEYVLPPDVTEAYKSAPRTDEKSPSDKVNAGKWKGYTPPPMPQGSVPKDEGMGSAGSSPDLRRIFGGSSTLLTPGRIAPAPPSPRNTVMRLFRSLLAFTLTSICVTAAPDYARAQTDQPDPNQPWKASADLVKKFSERRREFNYVESKVPDYELPDPLVAMDGSRVDTPDAWKNRRRPELMDLFRDQVYGRRPETPFDVKFELVKEEKEAFDGTAVGREMKATVTVEGRHYSFPFVVFVPSKITEPVPAVVHINNRYFVPLDGVLEKHDPFWPARTLIKRGYATASFHTSDVDPDRAASYEKGIRSFFADGEPAADSDWRSLSAWGWAASRLLDYLETVDQVDASRVAVSGHSRGGKTALWAACEDPRFGIAYSNNSGCGGAALSRRAYGETVGRITKSFPHWFCKPFSRYAGREQDLPVDQHEVVALVAPRAVYVTSSDQDLWADPKGEYTSVVESAPVFQLLGKEAITERQMPPLDQPRVTGQSGYHVRSGGHNLGQQDWDWFLDFADLQFK